MIQQKPDDWWWHLCAPLITTLMLTAKHQKLSIHHCSRPSLSPVLLCHRPFCILYTLYLPCNRPFCVLYRTSLLCRRPFCVLYHLSLLCRRLICIYISDHVHVQRLVFQKKKTNLTKKIVLSPNVAKLWEILSITLPCFSASCLCWIFLSVVF